MSSLNPIISLLFTAYSHPRSILHLVNLYHLIILCQVCHRHAKEHTKLKTKVSNQPRQCTHIAKWYQNCVPNALCHTNTGCRASRFKAYFECIRAPSPREKDCGRSVKSMAKENTHCKEICFAKVVRNPIGLQRILFGKYQQM